MFIKLFKYLCINLNNNIMRTRNLMIAFAMTGLVFSAACANNKEKTPKEGLSVYGQKRQRKQMKAQLKKL